MRGRAVRAMQRASQLPQLAQPCELQVASAAHQERVSHARGSQREPQLLDQVVNDIPARRREAREKMLRTEPARRCEQ